MSLQFVPLNFSMGKRINLNFFLNPRSYLHLKNDENAKKLMKCQLIIILFVSVPRWKESEFMYHEK